MPNTCLADNEIDYKSKLNDYDLSSFELLDDDASNLLKDLGIDIDDATEDTLKQFDLNGFLDQISDNRLKEKDEKVEELKKDIENEEK